MTKLNLNGRTVHCSTFKSLAAAWRWADGADLPLTVVLGACPEFWVVTLADAQRLVRAGFELAER